MSTSFIGLFKGEANRTPESRLQALKLRTLLVAGAALLCGFFGARLVVSPLSRLITMGYGIAMQQASLPLAHVPLGNPTDLGNWLPQAVFFLVSVLAVVGFSLGAFKRTSAWVVMIPPLVVGIATAYLMPSSSRWMHVVPSKLERDIMHGRFDEADNALNSAGMHATVNKYVQAQIALRANDDLALRTYGEAVLKLVDRLTYSLPATADSAPDELRWAVRFKPEVIHALDVALNGEPLTEVGIRWQKDHALREALPTWLAIIARLVLGLALLAASLGLLVFWNGMRRRVRIIQIQITPVQAVDLEK